MFYAKAEDNLVRCLLCPQACEIKVGERGKCRSRKNLDGKLYAANYGQSITLALDPIEKKPLYHFRPGSQILSLGPNSCNLFCFFCQNWDSSQEPCPTQFLAPGDLLAAVRRHARGELRQVAFTYTEPFTWYEYIYDFAQLAPDIDIVLVTNGYVNPEPLSRILPFLKAMNIDLKSIRDDFYRQRCGASIEPVLNTIRKAFTAKAHIEVTNLLIPGLNDSERDIRDLTEFVATVSRQIPLHFSAYRPAYRASIPATEPASVLKACEIASAYLDFVYAGNIRTGQYQATLCPNCRKTVISTSRQNTGVDGQGHCTQCGTSIYGVF